VPRKEHVTAVTQRILILGIGNPLMTDEGVGVRVAEILMGSYELPEGIEVIDAGTMGLGILNLFRDRDLVIVLDAVDNTGHEPGTVVIMTPEQLAPAQVMHSLHDMRFSNVLEAAALTGVEPEAICVGVQVESMEQWVMELTPAVEEALPAAVAAVLDILAERGVTLTRVEGTTEDAAVIEAIRTRAQMPGT
jgi:hydrogenase maturation protease